MSQPGEFDLPSNKMVNTAWQYVCYASGVKRLLGPRLTVNVEQDTTAAPLLQMKASQGVLTKMNYSSKKNIKCQHDSLIDRPNLRLRTLQPTLKHINVALKINLKIPNKSDMDLCINFINSPLTAPSSVCLQKKVCCVIWLKLKMSL